MLFIVPFATAGSVEIPTVTIVQDAAYPPFMTAGTQGAAGIYADIIYEADSRLPDFNISLEALPWTRAKYLVETGRANALLGTYFWPKQRPWIGKYSLSLINEEVHVYCRQGVASKNWTYPDDYAGLLFSNNSGFGTPGTAFFQMVEEGKIAVVEEQTTEENLRLLQIGRADCYVQEKTTVIILLKTGRFNNIEAIQEVNREAAHIGYSKKWTDEYSSLFISRMDSVLKEMKADGTIAKILDRHMQN